MVFSVKTNPCCKDKWKRLKVVLEMPSLKSMASGQIAEINLNVNA